jgi:hypothetical protein
MVLISEGITIMQWPPALLLLLICSAGISGCATAGLAVGLGAGAGSSHGTVQANSRSIEELFLSSGPGPELYRYGEDLLYQGRYHEALNAYYNCEMVAYTSSVREAARARRMWLQEVVLAYETGAIPPPPPVVKESARGAAQVTPKPIYEGPYASGNYTPAGEVYNPLRENLDTISVVTVNPDSNNPITHYEHNGGAYNLYGYSHYPGDIAPEQVEIHPSPTRIPQPEAKWYNPITWW